MKRRGLTMIELIVAGAILVILMTGLLSIFTSIEGARSFSNNMPQSQYNAEQMAETIAAAIRKAPLAQSADSTCTLNAAVESASATSLTIYSGTAGLGTLTKTTYANSGGNVTVATNGGTASTLYSNASVAFAYYTNSTYHVASGSSLTAVTLASGASLSTTQTPQLIAVQITTSVTTSGRTSTYSTTVRLRNGPLKTSPSD